MKRNYLGKNTEIKYSTSKRGMAYLDSPKRKKIDTSSLVKFPKNYTQFTITINSNDFIDAADSSPVNFKYAINREGRYFRNGRLNFFGGEAWEVCLSRLDMPNNFISFPSISSNDNLNAAYFVLRFVIKCKIKGETKNINIEQPYFFPHEKYTIPSLKDEILNGIRKLFSYFCGVNNAGINIPCELFLSCCFHIYIDPRSKFVCIKILGVKENVTNPFFQAFKNYFKNEKFIEKEHKEWKLDEIRIYFSLHLVEKLGIFDFTSLEEFDSHSNIFENVKLDRLIFLYKNTGKQEYQTYISSIPYPINDISLMYFKTSIVENAEEGEYTTIASIPIPLERSTSIRYEPHTAIWYAVKNIDIREIPFIVTDEKKRFLNYTNGNINFSLSFRSNTS